MRRIFAAAILLALTCSFASRALYAEGEGKELMPYRHIAVLGADKPVSDAYRNKMSPVIAYFYFLENRDSDFYGQFTLKTTQVYFILGFKNNLLFTGIKPQLNHTIYGAYTAYDRGMLDESRVFKSHNAGA